MSSSEYTYWLAYQRIDPFGSFRDDWRMGQLTCLTANINRGKNKPAHSLRDFMWSDVKVARKSKLETFRLFLKDKAQEDKKDDT